jgi:hypothetical protein
MTGTLKRSTPACEDSTVVARQETHAHENELGFFRKLSEAITYSAVNSDVSQPA